MLEVGIAFGFLFFLLVFFAQSVHLTDFKHNNNFKYNNYSTVQLTYVKQLLKQFTEDLKVADNLSHMTAN